MTFTQKARAVAALVVAVAITVAVWPRHGIGSGFREGQILWHDDEAFVFLVSARTGFSGAYGEWLLTSRLGLYGVPVRDSNRKTYVYRLTMSEIEEHTLDGAVPWLIAADGFVSTYDQRWVYDRFEPYTPREIPNEFAKHPPQEFADVQGWSKRTFLVPRRGTSRSVAFSLGGRQARLLLSAEHGVQSVDLERDGAPIKRLASAPMDVTWVSSSEYAQAFSK